MGTVRIKALATACGPKVHRVQGQEYDVTPEQAREGVEAHTMALVSTEDDQATSKPEGKETTTRKRSRRR